MKRLKCNAEDEKLGDLKCFIYSFSLIYVENNRRGECEENMENQFT